MIYPGDVVAKALKLTPDPDLPVWQGSPSTCSHCGRPITEGLHYSKVSLGQFFSDTRDLASASGLACWQCVHLRKKTLLNGLSYTVVTEREVYPIAQNIHKAWLFLTPPDGPFLALHSSSTMQHLAWRTPVTLDNRLISIRFGGNLFTVRTPVIRKALEIAHRINDPAKPWVNPLMLDRKATAGFHGLIHPKAAPLLAEDEIEFLMNITAGERWALSAVMNSKRPEPVIPDPMTETIRQKLK